MPNTIPLSELFFILAAVPAILLLWGFFYWMLQAIWSAITGR